MGRTLLNWLLMEWVEERYEKHHDWPSAPVARSSPSRIEDSTLDWTARLAAADVVSTATVPSGA